MKVTPSFECDYLEFLMLSAYLEEQGIPFDTIDAAKVVYVDANRELTKEQWKYIVNNIM